MTSFITVPKYIEQSKLGEVLALDEYQQLAMRTAKPLDRQRALEHAALGMCSDAGELLSVLKAWKIYGKPLYVPHAREECGDVLWFIAYAAWVLGERLSTLASRYVNLLDSDLTVSATHHGLRLMGHVLHASNALAFPEYFKHEVAMDFLAAALERLERVMDEFSGLGFQEVAQANIAKLSARYPKLYYTDADAIARADKAGDQ